MRCKGRYLFSCLIQAWLLASLGRIFDMHMVALAFQRQSHTRLCRGTTVYLTSGTDEEPSEDLLSKAARLRQEAQDLETKLRASSPSGRPNPVEAAAAPVVYRDVKDSVWTFSYLFAESPEDDTSSRVPVTKYGGKLTLYLRPDGYTDIVHHHPSASISMDIVKAWGWDIETSAEDEQEYVLFSVDAIIPSDGRKERFYFQARKDKGRDGEIRLQDGTVTMKQDVTETKDGSSTFWGLFSPKGILARFTYVGNFVARPSRKTG